MIEQWDTAVGSKILLYSAKILNFIHSKVQPHLCLHWLYS